MTSKNRQRAPGSILAPLWRSLFFESSGERYVRTAASLSVSSASASIINRNHHRSAAFASGRALFAYSAVRLSNDGTSTTTEGECLSAGKQFNGRQEAFLLAQKAEEYRAGHPFNGNYGAASYTLCYADGSQQRVPSPIAPGYDNTTYQTKPRNDTYSELALYRWLQNQLETISFDPQDLAGLHMIIYSKVKVCDECISTTVSWQSTLPRVARTDVFYLAIWEIQVDTPSAFNPTAQPRRIGTLVANADLRRVTLRFTP